MQSPAQLNGIHGTQPLAQLFRHVRAPLRAQRLGPVLQKANESGVVKAVGLVHRMGRVPAMGKTDYSQERPAPRSRRPRALLQMFGEVALERARQRNGALNSLTRDKAHLRTA